MSSDRNQISRRRLGLIIGLTGMVFLAGCQVRPLYSEASGTGQKLASVGFSEPKTRIDQVVRNNLIFLTTLGAGEAKNPEYDVKLSTTSTVSSILDDDISSTGIPMPGRVQVSGTYTVTRVKDGQVLKTSQHEVVSLIDISRQGFAKLRAVRDAENRASRELAEFIRADIAMVLAREPQTAGTWK